MSEEERIRELLSPENEERIVQLFNRLYGRMRQQAPGLSELPRVGEPWKPSKEEEKIIKDFMELVDSEIKKYAEDLIRMEIRDKILKSGKGAIDVIKEAVKKGKKPKLKRKKGCIFIQFGEGTPKDPIEEILIAST